MNWFYSPDGSERFEVSETGLLKLIRDGKVTRDMLVWSEGMADWMPAGQAKPSWFAVPSTESAPAGPRVESQPTEPATEAYGLPPAVEPGSVVPLGEASPVQEAVTPPPPAEVGAPAAEPSISGPPAPPPAPSLPEAVPPPPPPPPVYYPPVVAAGARDSAAMSSVISGAIGLALSASSFCCCFGAFLAPVAGITAVILGHMTYNKAQGDPEAERDKNLAMIGLILGYLTLALTLGA